MIITSGLHDTRSSHETEKGTKSRYAKEVFAHPDYDSSILMNDIAVIRLDEPVTFDKYIQPACLPGSDPEPDSKVILIGWGVVSTSGELSPVLKQTQVSVIDHCKRYWSDIDDAKQLCVKDETSNSATCEGHNGDPALQQQNGQWIVEGVMSFRDGVCEAVTHELPDVYTRVSAYLYWIHATTKK